MLECSIFNCKKEGVVASDQSGYRLINALAVCMVLGQIRQRLRHREDSNTAQEIRDQHAPDPDTGLAIRALGFLNEVAHKEIRETIKDTRGQHDAAHNGDVDVDELSCIVQEQHAHWSQDQLGGKISHAVSHTLNYTNIRIAIRAIHESLNHGILSSSQHKQTKQHHNPTIRATELYVHCSKLTPHELARTHSEASNLSQFVCLKAQHAQCTIHTLSPHFNRQATASKGIFNAKTQSLVRL